VTPEDVSAIYRSLHPTAIPLPRGYQTPLASHELMKPTQHHGLLLRFYPSRPQNFVVTAGAAARDERVDLGPAGRATARSSAIAIPQQA